MKKIRQIVGIVVLVILFSAVVMSFVYAQTSEEACKKLLTLSTKFGGPLQTRECSSCGCEDSKVYTLRQLIKKPLSANADCDKTKEIIPAGSIFKAEIKRTLKIEKGCFLGVHEGKFWIIDPKGKVLFSGRLSGTEGVKSWEGQPSPKRCCVNTTKEFGGGGILEGKGTEKLADYELKATYVNIFEFDPKADLYSKTAVHRWTTHIDGALITKCK
jgi:hypothetical protein